MRGTVYGVFTEQAAYARRASALLLCRYVVIFLFLAAMLLPTHREVFNHRTGEIFSLLVALSILNSIYLILSRRVKNLRALVAIQMAVDLAAISAIVYLSGGENSAFLFLYFASIIGAGAMISPRSSLLFASFSAISLAGITIARFLAAYYGRPLPLLEHGAESALPDVSSLFYSLTIHSLGFYVVAILTAALSGRLNRMRDLNRQIVEQFRDGMIVIDAEGRIIFANDTSVALLGFRSRGEMVNRPVESVFKRESDAQMREVLKSSRQQRREIRYSRGRNEFADVSVAAYPMFDRRRGAHGLIAVLTDMTAQRRMEQAVRVAEHLKEIQQMSAGLAHEIRNPLASIRGCAQQLGRKVEKGGHNARLAGIICRESDRLDGIIQEFLQFARMRPPKKRRCDLGEILDEVADLVDARRGEKRFTLVRDYPRGLACKADRGQMVQMFLNLAVNAFEAIGEEGTIRFVAERRDFSDGGDGAVCVRVCDDGRGIAPMDVKHVFTPFFTTKDDGVGLGLSIVSTIAEQHGIRVDVSSEPNKGTQFCLTIPIEENRSQQAGEAGERGTANASAALGG